MCSCTSVVHADLLSDLKTLVHRVDGTIRPPAGAFHFTIIKSLACRHLLDLAPVRRRGKRIALHSVNEAFSTPCVQRNESQQPGGPLGYGHRRATRMVALVQRRSGDVTARLGSCVFCRSVLAPRPVEFGRMALTHYRSRPCGPGSIVRHSRGLSATPDSPHSATAARTRRTLPCDHRKRCRHDRRRRYQRTFPLQQSRLRTHPGICGG